MSAAVEAIAALHLLDVAVRMPGCGTTAFAVLRSEALHAIRLYAEARGGTAPEAVARFAASLLAHETGAARGAREVAEVIAELEVRARFAVRRRHAAMLPPALADGDRDPVSDTLPSGPPDHEAAPPGRPSVEMECWASVLPDVPVEPSANEAVNTATANVA